eukprot:2925828-Rhodomonas_salina.1
MIDEVMESKGGGNLKGERGRGGCDLALLEHIGSSIACVRSTSHSLRQYQTLGRKHLGTGEKGRGQGYT